MVLHHLIYRYYNAHIVFVTLLEKGRKVELGEREKITGSENFWVLLHTSQKGPGLQGRLLPDNETKLVKSRSLLPDLTCK